MREKKREHEGTERERERESLMGRQTDRQRQTDKQTESVRGVRRERVCEGRERGERESSRGEREGGEGFRLWFKQIFSQDEINIQKIIMCSSTSYSL